MIVVYDTPEQVAEAAAATVAWQVAARPSSTIGLAGGSTPAATYRLLAGANLDWSSTTLFLGDERWVDHDHESSNTRMVRETLGEAAHRLEAPDTSLDEPHAAAAGYTERLADRFDDGRPDLVLLGMGDDGHTASLFPGSEALGTDDAGFVANWVETMESWRLTATLPLICAARSVVFVVTGVGKASMVHRVFQHDERLPVQQVNACHDNVTWLLDAAAASHVS